MVSEALKMWKKESVNPQTLMLMDTQPVSGCKLLRSCFSLVMQLNQNQFYCFDPIGNPLISWFLHFVQSLHWESLYPASWWHFEETQSPRPGLSRVPLCDSCTFSLARSQLSGLYLCKGDAWDIARWVFSVTPQATTALWAGGNLEFSNDRTFILLVQSAGFLKGLHSQALDLKLVLMSVMSLCSRISQKPVCLNSIFNSNSLCSGDQQA